MVTITRKVLDISHHNDVTSWSQIKGAGIVGIIHKATEGTGYVDDTYKPRAKDALNIGLMWGAYHFANGSDVKAQVENFLNTTGIDNEMLYSLDWEDDPDGNTMSRSQAREWLDRVDQKTGRPAAVYGGNVIKEALGDDIDPFFASHRLWLCQYGTSPVVQPSWEDYWLWQYSDGVYGPSPHGCPGVSGDVDTNSWDGSDADLRAQWSGKVPRPERPPDLSRPPRRTSVVNINIRSPGAIVLVNGRLVEESGSRGRGHRAG